MKRAGFLSLAILAFLTAVIFVAPVMAETPGGGVAPGQLELPPTNSAPLTGNLAGDRMSSSATTSEPDLFFVATYTARCQLIVRLDEAKKRQQDYLVRINDSQTQKSLRESLTQAVAILGSQIASYTTALEQLEAARAKDELFAFRPSVEWCRDFSVQSSPIQ
jgi:hypothetical protein